MTSSNRGRPKARNGVNRKRVKPAKNPLAGLLKGLGVQHHKVDSADHITHERIWQAVLKMWGYTRINKMPDSGCHYFYMRQTIDETVTHNYYLPGQVVIFSNLGEFKRII